MEETKALKEVENSLRDFISVILNEEKGNDWIESCGISSERIIQWKERRETEKKKQKFNTPENRLLYYSDFFDLSTKIAGDILQKVSNYNKRLAIIGDYSNVKSKALKDFIYESNKTKQVIFVDEVEEALRIFKSCE